MKSEGLHPYGRAEHDHHDRGGEAEKTADERAAARRSLPEHRHQQDREIAACRHGEGQPDHEGDVLVLEDVAEHDRDDADRDGGELRDADLLVLGNLALGDDRGIKVMAHRRGPGEREARDHRQDGGERNRGDEAEEERAADRIGEMDGRHIGAAEQIGDLVVGASWPRP